MCRQSSLDVRLLGAGFRNREELKLHTHGYSHEQMKMKTADEVMCQRYALPIELRLGLAKPTGLEPASFD
ncbi:hypothetical protein V7x_37440 [Crateriforma conspicua]|uniref:Uncharacterized protein n=1 Tax=Crateriforma conspicua TaxID=2527996 RepID=A0A5C6FIC6_9PLAN|nr:hypothetical protein V7x_37440 [Crateriforma conspicua]